MDTAEANTARKQYLLQDWAIAAAERLPAGTTAGRAVEALCDALVKVRRDGVQVHESDLIDTRAFNRMMQDKTPEERAEIVALLTGEKPEVRKDALNSRTRKSLGGI